MPRVAERARPATLDVPMTKRRPLAPSHRLPSGSGRLENEARSLRKVRGDLELKVRCLKEEIEGLRTDNEVRAQAENALDGTE